VEWRVFRQQALFGLIDGLNGAVGLTIGLLRLRSAAEVILVALLARAGSSAVSMAGAQYQADESDDTRYVRMSRVAAMGLGYIASAVAPGLGFAFSVRAGVVVAIPATVAVLALVIWVRSKSVGWVKAAVTTVVIFLLAVGAGLLASLVG
jgi:hypothetical protein